MKQNNEQSAKSTAPNAEKNTGCCADKGCGCAAKKACPCWLITGIAVVVAGLALLLGR